MRGRCIGATQPDGHQARSSPGLGAGSQQATLWRLASGDGEEARNNAKDFRSPKADHRLTTQAGARIINHRDPLRCRRLLRSRYAPAPPPLWSRHYRIAPPLAHTGSADQLSGWLWRRGCGTDPAGSDYPVRAVLADVDREKRLKIRANVWDSNPRYAKRKQRPRPQTEYRCFPWPPRANES